MFALEKMIAPNKPRDERLNGLQESGLLESFLEPKLSNFLTGPQRTRMEELEALGDEIDIDPATAKQRQDEDGLKSAAAAPSSLLQPIMTLARAFASSLSISTTVGLSSRRLKKTQ
jgi:hypothetical protein